MDPRGNRDRLDWIDAARGIGIILVFYGHVAQCAFPPGSANAAEQMRFIYSFHMPLFFVVSGLFFRPARHLGLRLRQLVARRLVPVLFFAVLYLPLRAISELHAHAPIAHDARVWLVDYLSGVPDLAWLTWFLVCLFVCEVMAAVVLGRIDDPLAQGVFGVACVVGGVLFSNAALEHPGALVDVIGHTWFLSEAVVALGLYAIGHAAFPYLVRAARHRAIVWAAAVGGLVVVLATFQHNPRAGVVMMAGRRNGDPLPFLATGLAGTVAVFALGMLLARVGWLRAIGRDTLPLLGLNVFFFSYANPMLAHRWRVPDQGAYVFASSLAVTVVSIVVCVPALRLLGRHVPQLVGKAGVSGPWLPALEPSAAVLGRT